MLHRLTYASLGICALLITGCEEPVDPIAESCAGLRENGIIDEAAEKACVASREGYLAATEAEASLYAAEAFAIYERVRVDLETLFASIDRSDYPERDPLAISDLFLMDDADIARDQRARAVMAFSIVDVDENAPASIVTDDAMFETGNLPQRFIDDLAWPCGVVFDTMRECRGEFLLDKMEDVSGIYRMGIVALRLSPMTVEDFKAAMLENAENYFDWARSPEES